MKNYKVLAGSLVAAVVMLTCPVIPVLAEEGAQTETAAAAEQSTNTYVSDDGILSIELPDENWQPIQDPTKWIALSDGANLITLEHFSNGEKLPDIVVADSYYKNTLTAAFTTENEVFLANGFVIQPEMINAINEAMLSIKVLKYDTKLAVNKNAPIASEYTIVPRDMTMYVNVGGDVLNVRSGSTVDSYSIGELRSGAAVHVTGVVQRNGADCGWYQIAFGNGTGFVAAEYLTATPPAAGFAPAPASNPTPAPASSDAAPASDPDLPNETYLVYSQGSGRPVNITGNSGIYYDGEGNVFYAIGDGLFCDDYGAYYTTWMPESAPDSEVIGLISDGSGRPVTIMENEDGSYTDEEGNEYYESEDGTFYDDYDATYEVSGTND